MMLLPVWFPGPMFLLGVSLSRGWGLSPGESLSRGKEGLLGGSLSGYPPHTVKRGRYAFYWNAFLLSIFLLLCYPLKYHYRQVII